MIAGAIFVVWLLMFGFRAKHPGDALGFFAFDVRQLALVLWTLVALAILGVSIYQGLLGAPEMQVRGNDSTASSLQWFVDRSESTLPSSWMISVPLLVYRGAMLAWALWIAFALLRWLRWGWASFTTGGLWRKPPVRIVPAPMTYPAYPPPQGTPPQGTPPQGTPPRGSMPDNRQT